MNRYLIRALVAVLTFSIGVAVGSFRRPRHVRYGYETYRCKRVAKIYQEHYDSTLALASPAMTIENPTSDPLRITYSFTKLNPTNRGKRLVEFVVENQSGREISGYAIAYNSSWASNNRGGGGAISVSNSEYFVPFVSINCDADQLLNVWISSVDFKDGSRWTNPAHTFDR